MGINKVLSTALICREIIIKNAFVLLPLCDIAAEIIHPQLGKTYAELWQAYDQTSQKLWPVDFQWRGEKICHA